MLFSETNRSQNLLAGISLIGAPLLWLAGTFMVLSNGDTNLNGYRVSMIGSILLIPAILAIATRLWSYYPNSAPWLGLLGIFGAVSGVNWSMLGMVDSIMARTGVDIATVETILGAANSSLFVALNLSGIAIVVAMLIMPALLWRSGEIPSGVAILLIVGTILFPISWFVPAIAYGTWGLWLIGMGWVAGQILSQPENAGLSAQKSVAEVAGATS